MMQNYLKENCSDAYSFQKPCVLKEAKVHEQKSFEAKLTIFKHLSPVPTGAGALSLLRRSTPASCGI